MIVSEQYYQPSSNIIVIASSMAALNQANLFADFSLKRATQVLVEMCCLVQSVTGGGLLFGLRDAAGNVVGSKQLVYLTTGTDTVRVFYRQPIFGLTPGPNYRWYWSAMVASAGQEFDVIGTTSAADEAYMSMIVNAGDE